MLDRFAQLADDYDARAKELDAEAERLTMTRDQRLEWLGRATGLRGAAERLRVQIRECEEDDRAP